ncbi:cardiolipin synthase [Saccharicrinis fermentans]|uniref:Cardiolipin synthase n=1 Tax=Saccharicrinis fermentans DSM 9555 = JCM 21142 TaxID=869213 RepID=W7XW24_9BACT|nr:cardiolipin synthase [Saccharicrinis fermentans]GAF02470.1 cardiolipin synthase [Saccharicrinis fermentans DSM 9555 = JCM 21142]
MWWTENWDSLVYSLVLLSYLISILVVIGVMVLENRSPLKSLSWILVLLLLPLLGAVLYFFFGQNLRKQKIISRKGLKNHDYIREVADLQTKDLSQFYGLNDEILEEKKRIIQLQLNNSHSVMTAGNKVQLLNNGGDKFKVLFEELEKARHFIHLQYYIIEKDEVGKRLMDLLVRKAQEGVEVRVIMDDVGSWEFKRKDLQELRASGLEIYSFLTVRFPTFTSKLNYRNHRKIVVIDGLVGFLGGINVADRYIHGDPKYGIWRDTHLKVEGDAVNSLQTIFSIDWYFVSQQELSDEKYFPAKEPLGNKMVQISSSGPDTDWPGIMMGFFKIITTAKKYVYIASPYFMPSESILMALKTAAMGGVDVRIIIPEKSDAYITKLSSMSYLKEMMLAGVKFYFYKKGFIHCKLMVSDDMIASVGSANMDFRSFEQNFEVTAFVYDKDFALEVKESFMGDFVDSNEVVLSEWLKRPVRQKVKESLARLLSPLL